MWEEIKRKEGAAAERDACMASNTSCPRVDASFDVCKNEGCWWK